MECVDLERRSHSNGICRGRHRTVLRTWDRESAMHLMLRVHNEGIAECGTYSYEIAKAKATQVVAFAREHRHPLQYVIERKR